MTNKATQYSFITNKTLRACVVSVEKRQNSTNKLQDKVRLVSRDVNEKQAVLWIALGKMSVAAQSPNMAEVTIVDNGNNREVSVRVDLSDYLSFMFVLMLVGWMLLSMTLMSVSRFAVLLFFVGIPISVVWFKTWQRRIGQSLCRLVEQIITEGDSY